MNFELKFFFEILRVGISLPTIEVRFEHLNVAAEVHVGSRALSTFLNFSVNILEVTMCRYVLHLLILYKYFDIFILKNLLCCLILKGFLNYLHILPSRKKQFSILQDVSGVIKPSR
jgi:hypothetical protein